MSEERSKVIDALRQGVLNSKAEYVTVRRKDLLLALSADATMNQTRSKAATDNGPRVTDKKQ